ncbi:MAG TPA: helix-turn-helix transcriptional regulator [Ktedonobacteraceae bacterium]
MKDKTERASVAGVPFGDLLKSLRQRQNISQQELAARLGLHRNTLGKWERGDCLPHTRGMVMEIARRLRLDEQETRQLLQASLAALEPEPAPLWHIPYPRNHYFTGREELLQRLHLLLAGEQQMILSQALVLSGMGGMGKTQVAIEYAYRHVRDYTAILWVDAETAENLLASFGQMARMLNLPEQHEANQQTVVAALVRWLNSNSHWLLIVDNLSDPALLRRFLPAFPHGSWLFTTQRQTLGTMAHPLLIQQMTPEEGMMLLLRRARKLAEGEDSQQLSDEEHALADDLVRELDGLPLAIDQAGAYIEETQCSLAEYLELYRRAPLALLDERDAHTEHSASVVRTLRLAFAQIQQRQPAAVELLRVCAFLAPDAIPEELLLRGAELLGEELARLLADPLRYQAACKELLAYSLLRRQEQSRTASIHRLVQVVLRASLSEPQQSHYVECLALALERVMPEGRAGGMKRLDWQQLAWGTQLLPHALSVIALSLRWNLARPQMAALLAKMANYLYERGAYAEAKPLLQRALLLRQRLFGGEHAETARAWDDLGVLYQGQGRYSEAEPCHRRALEIDERMLAPAYPETSEFSHNLAVLYQLQARYAEAEPLFLRTITLLEQALPPEHPNLGYPLNNLAILYYKQGRYSEAEALFQRAWHIWEQALPPDNPGAPALLYNLAEICLEQGKYTEAEPLYQRALRMLEEGFFPDHPLLAYLLHGLATLYRDQQRYAEAEPLYQRALHLREQHLGLDHPEVAYSLLGLATLYRERGRHSEGEPLYQRALRLQEQHLGRDHPEVAATLQDLADLYREQRRYSEAKILYQRALLICEHELGPDHPEAAMMLQGLANLYRAQGEYAEAQPLYQRALLICERTLGQDHPRTLEIRNSQATS